MTRRFENSVAIVTGASRGIGFGIAQRLVAEGAKVAITARGEDALAEAVATLGQDNAVGIAGKADNPDHQDEAIQTVTQKFGPVSILVNNTGINPVYGPMIDLDLAAARKIVEVNDLSALSWAQKVYHSSLAAHGGAILNVTSVAGLGQPDGIGFYGSSKAMLIHITRQLAMELGPNVRVNGVAPAVVKTKFAEKLYAHDEAGVAADYPLGRLGTPADIAAAAAFLLSAEASWITGQILTLDGGLGLHGGV